MLDLQKRVGEWHVQTFGETNVDRMFGLKEKLWEEYLEADKEVLGVTFAMTDGRPINTEAVAAELADVYIVLLGIASRLGIDLQEAAEAKFAVVAARDQKARDKERGIR